MKPDNLDMCLKINCIECDYNNEKNIDECINISVKYDEIHEIDIIE